MIEIRLDQHKGPVWREEGKEDRPLTVSEVRRIIDDGVRVLWILAALGGNCTPRSPKQCATAE